MRPGGCRVRQEESSVNRRGWCKRSKFSMGRRILLDQTVGFFSSDVGGDVGGVEFGPHRLVPVSDWGGRYRLGHQPVGFDEQLLGSGIEPGSMYSQAYVSVNGVGGQARA